MAQYTYIDGDMEVLAGVLDDSGYFDRVVYSDPNDETITCYVGQLAMLTITKTFSGDNRGYTWTIRGINPVFTQTADPEYDPDLEVVESYQCTGGLFLKLSTNGGWYNRHIESVVITKNQVNNTTIVFNSTDSSDTTMAFVGAIAATDTGDFAYLNANDNIHNQTSLVAVCSCNGMDGISYTPKVKVPIYKQRIDFGYIS